MFELKTNTATRIAVGPLVDPTDGKTAETALTVTDLSVQLYQIKNDGSAVVRTQFAPTASGGDNDMALVTSSTDGVYDLELTAAQLNFLGNGRITFYDVDGFLVHWIDILVVSAAYFDWKYGTTKPEMNLADDAITAAKYDESTAFPLKSADTGSTAVSRTGADSDTLETLSDQIDGIVTTLGAAGAGLTAIPWNAAWDAEVQSECADALNAYDPPTNAEMIAAIPAASAVADAVWDEAISGHLTAGTTGNALNAAGSAGDPWSTPLPGAYGAGTAGKIIGDNINATISSRSSHSAADVWAVATRTLTSFGTLVSDIWASATRTLTAISDSSGITTLLSRIGAALTITGGKVDVNDKTGFSGTVTDKTGFSLTVTPPTAADIKTAMEVDGGKLDHLWEMTEDDGGTRRLTTNALEQAPSGGSAPTAAQVADAVWDELLTDHIIVGSAGAGLSAAGSAGDPWSTPLPGAYGEGTAGNIIGHPSVVLPVMQGLVYTATAMQNREVIIVQGDTPRITFDLDADYTGWTPYFAAKEALADATYVIDPKAGTWTTAASGEGYVDLTALETTLDRGRYYAELELRNGAQRLTAMKFTLKIIDAVINE